MKILFYGVGPLGSLYAARLQESGQDVSVLARGQRLADLREYGIVLEDAASGNRTTTQVDIVDRLDPKDAYDLVVVLMRKNKISAILPTLAENQNTPNVLFMCNNVLGPDEM
ncbi:MAG: alpha/beta hydrolase, partial [Deltaproteobacteria bacterium]|nr:alpha/beta hydrolase [Deltaproteobacteria bacterium]